MTTPLPGWANEPGCQFAADGYHVAGHICYLPTADEANVAISAQVRQVASTTDELFGFVLRRVHDGSQYEFLISTSGDWTFQRCEQGLCQSVASGDTPAFDSTPGASNSIRAVLHGTHCELYVNGEDIGGLDDPTYSHGYLGVIAGSAEQVVFVDLSVTSVP